MYFWQKIRWFHCAVIGISILFFGIMVLVTVVAYLRPSGSTGLDMAKVQQIRYESRLKEH